MAMQSISRVYVQYFNQSYKQTGTLWEERYKATLIDSDAYAFTCYRYTELNPVRAEMIVHPGEYPWSSFRYNALGMSNPILTPHYLYHALGSTVQIRQENYLRLFDTHIPLETIENIREMTNKAWVLGSELFKQKIPSELQRPLTACSIWGDRKSQDFHHNRNNPTQTSSIKKAQ